MLHKLNYYRFKCVVAKLYFKEYLQIFDEFAEKEILSASDFAKLEVNLSPLFSKSPLSLPLNTLFSLTHSFRAFVTRLETSLGFFILSGWLAALLFKYGDFNSWMDTSFNETSVRFLAAWNKKID